MKEVFIKYNPYTLETEITVDGKKLAENSKLREATVNENRLEKSNRSRGGSVEFNRLQVWVESLPEMLIEEYNDTHFNITFHGTQLDYEDLSSVITDASKNKLLTAHLDLKPAKETHDKEILIDKIFEKIKQGPFEELNSDDLIDAFEKAKSSDFEICVVATMSSGKSTLINALLGQKLMPSKQEACTAVITRIKDTDTEDIPFRAEVMDIHGALLETHEKLTYETMVHLNESENVAEIDVTGNIPFVKSDDVSLVLIDTPGPNNSRDTRHKELQYEFLKKSSKPLILYIITPEFGTTDDDNLLKDVAESMAVGGKQSKDRFIFVVNKFDTRKIEDGSTKDTLERIRCYLEEHGITNPNLFAAAALPALNIRLMNRNGDIDRMSKMETELSILKLNSTEYLHLENYAPLPQSIQKNIEKNIEKAKMEWVNQRGEDDGDPNEALIHTGIVSIEAAIRQYVQKYAKTAKIKNIVDTFNGKLEEIEVFEKIKAEIIKNKDKHNVIINQINNIIAKRDCLQKAHNFEDNVAQTVDITNAEVRKTANEIIEKFFVQLKETLDTTENTEIETDEALKRIESLNITMKNLEPSFRSDLENVIQRLLTHTGNILIENYKKQLISLTDEINLEHINCVEIDPLTLMSGSISSVDISIDSLTYDKAVENGTEWITNTDKRWYKPWTWLQEDGYYRKLYKNVKFISVTELTQNFLTPVEKIMIENGNKACDHARSQSEKIAAGFKEEFKQLDDILDKKLCQLKKCTEEKYYTEERITKLEIDLKWIENIQKEIQSILEI